MQLSIHVYICTDVSNCKSVNNNLKAFYTLFTEANKYYLMEKMYTLKEIGDSLLVQAFKRDQKFSIAKRFFGPSPERSGR